MKVRHHPVFVLVLFWMLWGHVLPVQSMPRPEAVPGGVVVVTLGAKGAVAPRASYLGHPVWVEKRGQDWVAIVGIPLTEKAGTGVLEVISPGTTAKRQAFVIGEKTYEAQYITLKNKRMVHPTPLDLERINREKARMTSAYDRFSHVPPQNDNFILPVEGVLSSPFGLRRFFNNEPRKPHSGLDIAAPEGTPVRGPADGQVIVVGDFFFNGRTVFVDHGMGVISMFCHLSEIDVRMGERLRQGEMIGRVGSTGRATGPHLHWSVSMNGFRVDPALFVDPARMQSATEKGE